MHDEGRLDGPGPAYSNIGFDVGNVARDAKNIVDEDGTTTKPQPACLGPVDHNVLAAAVGVPGAGLPLREARPAALLNRPS